jgi:hypothetical protein
LYGRLKKIVLRGIFRPQTGEAAVWWKTLLNEGFRNLYLFTKKKKKNVYDYEITKEDERGGMIGGILVK